MRALSAEKLAMLLEVARSMAYAHTATSGEGRRFRVSGLPELPRPINTPEDVERFLEELSPEERARLAEALGRG